MIAAVVVSYGSEEEVAACLASIDGGSTRPSTIVVWDNDSPDRSVAVARACLPSAQVVANATNMGFAAAVNAAAELVPGADLLLVNPDARLGASALRLMRAVLEAEASAAVVSCHLLSPQGVAQTNAWAFPTPRRAIIGSIVGLGRAYRARLVPARASDRVANGFAPFTAVLLRRAVFDELGGLDAAFWLYGEDADYCLRAVRAGHEVHIAKRAEAVHVGGASSNTRLRESAQLKGNDLFRQRNFGAGPARAAGRMLHFGARLRLLMRGTRPGQARFSEWEYVREHYEQAASS